MSERQMATMDYNTEIEREEEDDWIVFKTSNGFVDVAWEQKKKHRDGGMRGINNARNYHGEMNNSYRHINE